MKTAKELGSIPTDLKYFSKFNNLKSSVLQFIRLEKPEESNKLELVKATNGDYAFPERLVNVMMEYAYRQGRADSKDDFEKRTLVMKNTIDKIVASLDDGCFITNE